MHDIRLLLILVFIACALVTPYADARDKETGKHTKDAEQAAATLTWDAPTTNTDGSPLTDLKGYYIYYRHPGEEDFDEDHRIEVPVDDKGLKCRKAGGGKNRPDKIVCTYVVTGLRGPHYFAVSAFGKNNESELSNEVLKESKHTPAHEEQGRKKP